MELGTNPAEFKVRTIQPAVNFDNPPAGRYAWLVGKRLREQGSPYRGGAIYYRRLQWNGAGVAELVDTSWQPVVDPTPTYRDYFDLQDGAIKAPQLGDDTPPTGPLINLKLTGSRLMNAVIRNNVLWTCQHVGLTGVAGVYVGDATGAAVDRAGIQWLKLQVGAGGQSLTYAPHGRIFDDCPTHANPF